MTDKEGDVRVGQRVMVGIKGVCSVLTCKSSRTLRQPSGSTSWSSWRTPRCRCCNRKYDTSLSVPNRARVHRALCVEDVQQALRALSEIMFETHLFSYWCRTAIYVSWLEGCRWDGERQSEVGQSDAPLKNEAGDVRRRQAARTRRRGNTADDVCEKDVVAIKRE